MGLILGYIIVNKVSLDRSKIGPNALGIAALVSIVVGVMLSHMIDIDFVPSFIKYMINPIMRTLLGAFVCIFFYSAWNGNIPVFASFLSLRLFVVLGKFSYSTFMMHFLVVWYHIGTLRQQYEYFTISVHMDVIALYCISLLLGYLVYIIIEAPSIKLVKMAFAKNKVV